MPPSEYGEHYGGGLHESALDSLPRQLFDYNVEEKVQGVPVKHPSRASDVHVFIYDPKAVLMSVLALKRLSQQDQTCQQHRPDRCAYAQAATLVIIAAFSLGEKCDRRRGQVERESTLNCRKSILIARAGQLQQFHPAFRKWTRFGMSSTYNIKSSGPKTDPWGTPLRTGARSTDPWGHHSGQGPTPTSIR
ncbi:hypothetical protein LSAT2_000465 [Lamellibrachia satsuma]|nr:hypothetical protein LSAT2_000465 [Lamellibrachia satsuma]